MKKFGEYIEKLKEIRIFPERKEGQSGEEYAKQRMMLGLKYGIFALTAFAVLRGLILTAGSSIRVSNSVNGRELPIYCVETKEPKIALTFDAAWGNEDTQKILEILKKHDVHVTFFMTGGWVESYPDDVKAILDAKDVPRCSCGGIIKPDVVLYEEGLDSEVLEGAISSIRNADMLIVGGTSLVVYPAAGLIDYYRGNKLVLINKASTGMDQKADLVINGKIGEIFSQL